MDAATVDLSSGRSDLFEMLVSPRVYGQLQILLECFFQLFSQRIASMPDTSLETTFAHLPQNLAIRAMGKTNSQEYHHILSHFSTM